MKEVLRISIFVPLLMFGLMAGIFYVFSVSVAAGSGAIAPQEAIRIMQVVKYALRSSAIIIIFFLTPFAALAVALLAYSARQLSAALLLVAATGIYVVGVMGVTLVYNAPLLRDLSIDPLASRVDVAMQLRFFSQSWIGWNNVRVAASLIAFVIGSFALFSAPGRKSSASYPTA